MIVTTLSRLSVVSDSLPGWSIGCRSAVLAALLAASGCSDSDSGSGSRSDDSVDVAPIADDGAGSVEPTVSMSADTMIDILRGQRAEYSELLAIIDATPELTNLMGDSERRLTLFAPGNGAFAREFESLGRLTDEERADVVRSHFLLVDLDATAAMASLDAPQMTAAGSTVRFVQASDGALQLALEGGVTVALNAGSALTTSNGTIYTIDRLLPASIAESTVDDEPVIAITPTTATGIMRSTPELSEFSALVDEGFFDFTLADPRNTSFIIIAPSNGNLDVGDASISEYLRAHIINNPALGSVLTAETHFSTLNQSIDVGGTPGALTIGGAPLRLIAGPGTPGGAVYLLDGELP